MVILCTIDLETREVSLPAGQVIASYDHNVDVIRFQAEAIPGFSLDTSSIKIAAQGPNNVRHDYAVDPSTVSIEEETGYITFDWPIPQGVTEMPIGTFKYGDKGRLIFAVCAEIISGSTLSKAWHSDDGIITVVAHLEPEAGGGEDPEEEATNAQKIAQLQTNVAVINTQVGALANGSPTPVATVAEMTDESAVYLYTGSETGYTAGDWYYYDGTAWTSGGTYGGAVTSTTFDKHGVPADDFAVGQALALKADSSDVTALDTRVTAVEGDVSDLKEDLNSIILTETHSETVTETIALAPYTGGYVTADGTAYPSSSYNYSQHFEVSPGDVITVYRESDGLKINSARFMTAYKNGVAVSALGGANISIPYTVPESFDADEIVFSIDVLYGNATGTRITTVTTENIIPLEKPAVDTLFRISASKEQNSFVYKFDVASSEGFSSDENFEEICGYRVCFFAKITNITGINKIGKGIGSDYGGGIGFDGTNLYQYMDNNATPVRTQAHGLTLKDYVSITLDAPYTVTAKCTIKTNGGEYVWTIPVWRSRRGALSVQAVDAMTDCVLSYTCAGLLTDTWMYGDSYFNNHDANRWTTYLVTGGYHNYLLNGYSGRNSSQALRSLKVDLSMNRVPRRIVWCMGMNDKDGESAPNTSWKNCVEEVMDICDKNHIELVLTTIPNVPSTATKNDMKNAYVRASGYRYIDFANAISADGSSTWYDGMLSSDNVHPDVQGAIALYSCAVTEVPELML